MEESGTGRRDSLFGPRIRAISSGSSRTAGSGLPACETIDAARPSRTSISAGPPLTGIRPIRYPRVKIRIFPCSSEYVPGRGGFPATRL